MSVESGRAKSERTSAEFNTDGDVGVSVCDRVRVCMAPNTVVPFLEQLQDGLRVSRSGSLTKRGILSVL